MERSSKIDVSRPTSAVKVKSATARRGSTFPPVVHETVRRPEPFLRRSPNF